MLVPVFAAVRRKLSLEACAKAHSWGQTPRALAVARLWALPTPLGASASCREALGAGKWKPGHGCFWQYPSLSLYIRQHTWVLLPLTSSLPDQSKYLSWVSVYLLVFGNLPWRCVGIRTGQGIRRNVSVKAAAEEERKVALFFFPPSSSETKSSKITISGNAQICLKNFLLLQCIFFAGSSLEFICIHCVSSHYSLSATVKVSRGLY